MTPHLPESSLAIAPVAVLREDSVLQGCTNEPLGFLTPQLPYASFSLAKPRVISPPLANCMPLAAESG